MGDVIYLGHHSKLKDLSQEEREKRMKGQGTIDCQRFLIKEDLRKKLNGLGCDAPEGFLISKARQDHTSMMRSSIKVVRGNHDLG
jgi:hypothetical protein